MTTRRGFLATMLAASAAPAIVRANSLMPIWTPPSIGNGISPFLGVIGDLRITKGIARIYGSMGDGDWTIESWIHPTECGPNGWRRIDIQSSAGKISRFLDATEVRYFPPELAPSVQEVRRIAVSHIGRFRP